MTTYFKNCQKCRKKTNHRISEQLRKYGTKLKCLECGKKSRWIKNSNNLKDWEIEDEKM